MTPSARWQIRRRKAVTVATALLFVSALFNVHLDHVWFTLPAFVISVEVWRFRRIRKPYSRLRQFYLSWWTHTRTLEIRRAIVRAYASKQLLDSGTWPSSEAIERFKSRRDEVMAGDEAELQRLLEAEFDAEWDAAVKFGDCDFFDSDRFHHVIFLQFPKLNEDADRTVSLSQSA